MRCKLILAALGLGVGIAAYFFLMDRYSPANMEAERKEQAARAKLAFQSLEERLPPRKATTAVALSGAAAERWHGIEERIESGQDRRGELLKALHEKTRKFFVESSGFGSYRRVKPPDESILLNEWDFGPVPDQPGFAAAFPLSPGEDVASVPPNKGLYEYHASRVIDFVYPPGLGYVKDRKNVSGFQQHGFRIFNDGGASLIPWTIQHVLLVGILVNEQPVVYLSDKLPSMELVRKGKTRGLDYFEESGLETLRNGEDLAIVQKGDVLRMLGAVRATKQCLQCHDAEKGSLLGAFSYTLARAESP